MAKRNCHHADPVTEAEYENGQIALLAIAIFGLGYWMVPSNPTAYRGIVILGLIGKIGVVAIAFGHYFCVGDVNFNLAGLTLGDMSFAALFFRYLKATGQPTGAIP